MLSSGRQEPLRACSVTGRATALASLPIQLVHTVRRRTDSTVLLASVDFLLYRFPSRAAGDYCFLLGFGCRTFSEMNLESLYLRPIISFVKVSRLSSQHEAKCVVSCSVRVSEITSHRTEARAKHILSATKDHVIKAIDAINRGQVIAVPTDTIYGFACDACSAEAVKRIYEIKGRIHTRPLAICVADVPDISRFAVVDHLTHGLLGSLLPGPVTVVLKRGENSILERSLNPGLDSIGVRVPNLDFVRAIARGAGSALALTSANLSGRPSSVSVKDFEDLWPHCSNVFDGGILPSGRAGSTIVDLITPGVYKIIREGSSREETTAVLDKFGFVEAS